jgi:CheY-like chemotaxis protein
MLSIDVQMAQSKADAATSQPAEAERPKPVREGTADGGEEEKIILAVDDVSLFLNTLKSVVQGSPYKFFGVSSGSDALRFLEKKTPDLFILDIVMPNMNGDDLAKRIKALGHTAPIIFLTANSAKEYVIRAIQAGAVDFIVKPINNEHVLEKIEKYI